MVHAVLDVGARAFRMLPVCAGHVTPPLELITERHGVVRSSKNNSTGYQVFFGCSGEVLRAWRNLCDCDVALRLHKCSKLGIGDTYLVHPETVDVNPMPGPSVRHGGIVAAHPKLASRYPDHIRRSRFCGL